MRLEKFVNKQNADLAHKKRGGGQNLVGGSSDITREVIDLYKEEKYRRKLIATLEKKRSTFDFMNKQGGGSAEDMEIAKFLRGAQRAVDEGGPVLSQSDYEKVKAHLKTINKKDYK